MNLERQPLDISSDTEQMRCGTTAVRATVRLVCDSILRTEIGSNLQLA